MISDSAPRPCAWQYDFRHLSLALLALMSLASPSHAADFTWTGATSSDFTVNSNWSPATAPSPTGGGTAAPVAWRISVQGATNTLVYSAAQGHTVLSGGGSNRSLFIANSANGSMSITGGIFESTSTGADAMVNGPNSVALLSIDGGTYRKTTGTGTASTFGVFYAGTGLSKGTLDINSGSFEVTTLDLHNSGGSSTQAAGVYESQVNLDGGTLSVGTIVRTANSTGIDAVLNFNGGTLQARQDSTTFLAALGQFTANVQAGGAKIDTQAFNITIAAPLVHDTALGATADGGLTKVGTGMLTLSGASTYTGGTFIKNGTLVLAAGNDRLPTGTVVTLGDSATNDSGVLKIDSRSQTLAGLLMAGTGTGNSVVNGNATAATLTLGIAGSNTFAGVLGGTGTNDNNFGLTKTGAGTLTLSGTNTYTGATSIQAGTLQAGAAGNGTVFGVNSAVTLANIAGAALDLNSFSQTIGSLAGGGTTGGDVSLGSAALTMGGTNASTTFAGIISGIGGSINKMGTGTLTLSGVNTYTGLTTVSAGILNVANSAALGDVAGATSVVSGASLQLANGITVTGESISIAGPGANSMGALQAVAGGAAEWAGTVTLGSGARLGALAGGVLTVSGGIQNGALTTLVISGEAGTGTVLIKGTGNTYTGATQIIRGMIKLGSTNALPVGTTLDVDSLASAGANDDSTFDLNGFNQTVGALQRTGSAFGTGGSFITNSGATASTLTVTGGTTTYNGIIQNGTGGMNLVSGGTLTLQGANTYTGSTTVNSGTLKVGGVATASLASTSFILNGGSFTLDNTGAGNNNDDRVADAADVSFKGGSFIYRGSDQAATNSSETIHNLTVNGGSKTLSVIFGGINMATLTANQLTRPAQGGVLLVNGANLGMDSASTASVARVLLTVAPDLVGGTDALSTGINAAAQDTKIVPFLLGEVTLASGGLGTVTGTPNTFMTYDATTGLRPLNPIDEFTLNTITGGANTRITAATNVGTSAAINSLILDGAALMISSGQTLTVTSGAILLASGNAIGISGGTLAFGSREGIITINSINNTVIGSVITGTAGITYSGSGTLVLATQLNTYSGDTLLQVATVIPQSNSTGPAGAPTSGPFGKGTVIFNGSAIRATSSYAITIGNNVELRADTAMLSSGSVTLDKVLTFTGEVTLVGGNRTITQSSGANTVFTGDIGDGGSNLGLTIAGSGPSAVVLSGTSTYTGPTQVNGSTLQVGSNGVGSSGTGATTVASGATLAGSGTVQGATVMNAGSVLQPGDVTTGGTASTTVTNNSTLTFTAANTALTVNDGAQIRLGISSPTIAANVVSYSEGLFHYNGNDYSSALALLTSESGARSTWNTAPSSTGNHDFIRLTDGTSTLSIGNRAGGTWGQGSVVVNGTLGTVALGQVFNLIDWNGAAISGNFDVGGMTFVDASGNAIAGDLDLVALGAGFGWDVSAFKDFGIIIVVPEPGRACLLLLGLLSLGLRRRR